MPVISAIEYNICYFLIHRAYAHFFGDMNKLNSKAEFTSKNYYIIEDYIENAKLELKEKYDLKKMFKEIRDKDNFVELAIRKYTKDNNFCYFFNKSMRNFDKGLISCIFYGSFFIWIK